MSSGGGSSSSIQALPAGTWNRGQNDLRGFVKTGAATGGKDNPGVLDATKSSVQKLALDDNGNPVLGLDGKQRVLTDKEFREQTDRIGARRNQPGAANIGGVVPQTSNKTLLGA